LELSDHYWRIIWFFLYSIAAMLLLFLTERTYDRCMGRVSQAPLQLTNEQFLRKIGFRIRDRRLARRWTQTQLANRCGVTREYIESIECGERDVSHVDLRRIAKALRIPLSELFARLR
jgi:DNA-binding XRE family transcriptional regulator